MRDSWPMVGREAERRVVDEAILSGTRHGVLLAGPSGVGKTRLAGEAIAKAQEAGFRVESGRATAPLSTIPFGLFANLAGPGASYRSRTEMLTGLAEGVTKLAARGALLLSVDDAHLLDEGTAAFLHSVAVKGTARILATARSGIASDTLTGLWKDGHLARVDLRLLTATEIDDLMQEMLGGRVETLTRHRLRRLAAGNPLLLREVIWAATESGALRAHENVWRLDGPTVAGNRLDVLIEDRLADVSAPERRAIEALAVAEPLPVNALSDLVGHAVIEQLERRGILAVESGTDRVRLSHPLYGEVVAANLATLSRRRLLTELAEAVLHTAAPIDEDRFRAAVWSTDAGAVVDADLVLSAAQQALRLCDYRLALRLARRAQELQASPRAQLVAGHALYWIHSFEECEAQLARLDASATDEEKAEAVIVRASALFWGIDRVDAALELLRQTADSVAEPVSRVRLLGHRALLLVWSGTCEEARTLLAGLLPNEHKGTADPEAALRASISEVLLAALDGRRADVESVLSEMFPSALASRAVPLAAGQLLTLQTVAELLSGELQVAADLVAQATAWLLEHHGEDLLGAFTLLGGECALARGDLVSAIGQLQEALLVIPEHDFSRITAWAWAALATALAQTGDAQAASSACRRSHQEAKTATRLLAPLTAIGDAWTAAAQGRPQEGVDLLLAMRQPLVQQSLRAIELRVVVETVRLGGAARALSWLQDLAVRFPHSHATTALNLATGLIAQDPGLLIATGEEFASRGAYLLAAEAIASATAMYGRAGFTTEATRSALRCQALRKYCPTASTPLLASSAFDSPVPLTPREQEIAVLAAAGSSNRDIARRLVLSKRTVENHLARAYSKLGVNTRHELAASLMPQGTAAE